MRLTTLFPHLNGLRRTDLAIVDGNISLDLRITACTAACPLCHRRSRRVRSTYIRTLTDLPWGGMPVLIADPHTTLPLWESGL